MVLLTCFILWGLAEATSFYLVVDILISFVTIYRPTAALRGIFLASLGGVIGGFCMFRFGQREQAAAFEWLLNIPGINTSQIEAASELLKLNGLFSIFIGAFSGIPYKIFAVVAGASRISLSHFLLASFPARALRYLLIYLGTKTLTESSSSILSKSQQRLCIILCWILFYLWYFLR